ncbi:cell wall hydrolase [Halomonas sp. McH1-25]|uniref:cell wall hydrolase n=1 Tax=unclassified Halomonas TaxID=2609666 RepID=UPI001EF4B1D3|nr:MULTISPECIES: cell wall hydrolase [unclassified Halomonas]MCG7599338.1 cell wall hydrolase [Halomonas sp. McH1-25]MCP1343836.1 cell wall hydrolase [Halomonas sp. FL8]MCP1361119.1 cell wall hydrolase [Halomonas sp. BBD45]MCP1364843.1 cell wall hydrolase [Halomonas sp. BBD48]
MMPIRLVRSAICVVALMLSTPALAIELAQRAQVAEKKAEVLEQEASAEGSGRPPEPDELITRPGAQAVDPVGEAPLDDAITCLARSIYWEARGEGATDMEAVANVVMNRLGHDGFPDTVCGVVKQGSEQGNCQFSWWCDGRPDEAQETEAYVIAKEIARKALNQQLKDHTDGAQYFHHRNVMPHWASEFTRTFTTDEMLFYRQAR